MKLKYNVFHLSSSEIKLFLFQFNCRIDVGVAQKLIFKKNPI
jgi:hypothetical protein